MRSTGQTRWETIKTVWWTTFALAVFGNTLVAFFDETDFLRGYRYVAGALFAAATVVVIAGWLRRRRRGR